MNKRSLRARAGASVALGLLAIPAAAGAQETASAALDRVVVTAQKREQAAQDVPISLLAFGERDLAARRITSLRELQSVAPNLNFGSGNPPSEPMVGIRGVADYSRNIGNDARVGIYIDGVYQGRTYSADPDLIGVERVEVLRGPQGTLFGRNTNAGAINIVTRKPGSGRAVEASVDLGNLDYHRVSAIVDMPAGERGGLIVSLSDTARRGHVRNVTLGKDIMGDNRTGARATARFAPRADWEFLLGADYFHAKIDQQIGKALDPFGLANAPGFYELASDLDGFDRRETWGASFTANHDLSATRSLTAITAWREAEYRNGFIDEDMTPFPVAFSDFDEANTQFSQELRLTGDGDRLDWVAGVYFLRQDIGTQRSAGVTPLFFTGMAGRLDTPGEVDATSGAAFADLSYFVTERVELNAGARLTHEEKSIHYSSIDTIGLFANFLDFRDTRSDTDVDPRAGVNFHVSDTLMLYGAAARAHKSGGWNADFIPALAQIAYDPETATNLEAGAKGEFLDGRLTANVALFETAYDDFQVSQFIPLPGGTSIITITNAGEATSRGVEADLTLRATRALTLRAAGAYTKARFDSFRDGGGPGVDYDGATLPYAPEWTFAVTADYVIAAGEWGDAVLTGGYSYTSEYYSNPRNDPVEDRVDGYGLVDASLRFEPRGAGWSVAVWGRNLTDKEYFTARDRTFLGTPRGIPALPRTYGVSLNARF